MDAMTRSDWLLIILIIASNLMLFLWWIQPLNLVVVVRNYILTSRYSTGLFIFFIHMITWCGIFMLYRFPISGDVKLFFQPQARAAVLGENPISAYAPGFLYLLGYIDWMFPYDLTFPLLFTICLSASAIGSMLIFDRVNSGLAAIVVSFLNSASWVFIIGHQQDESIMLLFTILVIILIKYEKYTLAGVMAVIALLCTKILFALTILAVLLLTRRVVHFSVGAIVTFFIGTLLFSLLGHDLQLMVVAESGNYSPPSVTNILAIAQNSGESLDYSNIFALVCIGGLCLLTLVRLRSGNEEVWIKVLKGVICVWLIFVIFSAKSLPVYRLVFMPLILPLLDFTNKNNCNLVFWFLVWATALAVERTIYEQVIGEPYFLFRNQHSVSVQRKMWLPLVLALDSIILLIEFGWLTILLNVVPFRMRPRLINSGRTKQELVG